MLDGNKSRRPQFKAWVTYHMTHTQNRLNAQATYILRKHCGISLVEWRIILLADMNPNATLTKMAEISGMDKGQLSRKIRSLIEKGLLVSSQDKRDQRKQVLTTTAEAESMLDKMMPILQERQEFLTKGLSQSDLDAYYRVMEHLFDAAGRRDF